MPTANRGATFAEGLAFASIVLIVIAVALIVTLGNSESIQCSQYPACLASPGTLLGAVHTYAAGVVLLMLLVLTLSTFVGRRSTPGLWVPSAVSLLVLIVAAGLGALFAVGIVPTSWAPIQFVWFAIVVGLLILVVIRAHRLPRAPRTPTGS